MIRSMAGATAAPGRESSQTPESIFIRTIRPGTPDGPFAHFGTKAFDTIDWKRQVAGEGVTATTYPSYDQKSETRRVAVSLVCGRATAADSRMAAVNPTDDDRKLETAVIVVQCLHTGTGQPTHVHPEDDGGEHAAQACSEQLGQEINDGQKPIPVLVRQHDVDPGRQPEIGQV